DPTLWYYYRGEAPHLVLPPAAHDASAAQREAAQLAGDGVERVVLAAQPDPSWDDQGVAEAALAEHFRQTATLQVSRWSVSLYTQPPQTVGGPEAEYTNGLRLAGAVLASPTSTPQGVLVVHLAWDFAQAQLTGSETISLQLLHPSGHLVAQTDVPLLTGLDLTGVSTTGAVASYGILLPGTLALGPHRLHLVVYDPGVAGLPRILTRDGRETVDLFAVEVIRPPGDAAEMSEAVQESYAGAP
ncbi:MAG TPA: hypothetical protein VNK95_09620, partial [Caldilineaceae bacterium]|nr:hypothetical protein [Caldilineaceae bacterium]